MNCSTPALNCAGWLLNMLWVAPAMVSRRASGTSLASRSVTALMCAGESAPETSRVGTPIALASEAVNGGNPALS